MYATLPFWIVESGDLPAPTAGSVLVQTGVRASCLTVATSREDPGTVWLLLQASC